MTDVTIDNLPEDVQNQLAQALDMVAAQQASLDAVGGALRKWAEGEDTLTRQEQGVLSEHLRWTHEEAAAFEEQTPEERIAVAKSILATPYAYFYVGEPPEYCVYVKSGEKPEIRTPDHPEF